MTTLHDHGGSAEKAFARLYREGMCPSGLDCHVDGVPCRRRMTPVRDARDDGGLLAGNITVAVEESVRAQFLDDVDHDRNTVSIHADDEVFRTEAERDRPGTVATHHA